MTTLTPIAQQPGAGEHLWFFGGLTTIKAAGDGALVTEPGDFAGFVRALAEPAPGPELPPGPPTPPDMELVMKTAAEYGLEILGPPGIPA